MSRCELPPRAPRRTLFQASSAQAPARQRSGGAYGARSHDAGPALLRRRACLAAVRPDRGRTTAFTLVELLVSAAVILIIVAVVIQMTNQTSRIWRSTTSRIETFQEARAAFESMGRTLDQATLNTYWEYYDSNRIPRAQASAASLPTFSPSTYDRYSELHFISGDARTFALQKSKTVTTPIATQTHAIFFQAPTGYSVGYQGLDNALNARGYFLQFDSASASVPLHVQAMPGYRPRWRWRLMEMIEPTEQLSIYNEATGAWFVTQAAAHSRVIAENVIALVLLPKLAIGDDVSGVALAPDYNYNSRIGLGATSDATWGSTFPADAFTATPSAGAPVAMTRHAQLPPIVRVVMVAIDESSAERLQGTATTPPAALDLTSSGLFTDATKFEADLQAVQDICSAKPGNVTGNTLKLTYRVFNGEVIVRDAKWSNH